jgi:hypothetical protein
MLSTIVSNTTRNRNHDRFSEIHSSIVAILELIRGAQYLIEVIWSSGEEM